MKTVLMIIWTVASLAMAGPATPGKTVNPCDHPVIKKAKSEGLKSLSLKEIPQFWLAAWQCKRSVRRKGKEIDFRSLYREKQRENYEEARTLSGVGTGCLTFTVLILFYSYLGYALGAQPP
ncbi:MAG: hypothetical protein ACE5GH_03830 [Fidelibacterota bacterium]